MATKIAITDTEAMGEAAKMTHEEVAQLAQLTPEERAIEKRLRRRIDCIVMPLVILVYLMNYIDRYSPSLCQPSTTSRL